MFVKKDLRKIPQILADATSRAVAAPPSSSSPDLDPANNDNNDAEGSSAVMMTVVAEMRFARRAPEFLPSCDASLLLEPRYRPALDNLIQLSLYDCGLRTLAGIEPPDDKRARAPLFPRLEQLDVGRNPALANDVLPESFHTQFPRLLQVWLDDCSFGPNIPLTLLEMNDLQVVRITGNKLEGELEDGIGIKYWKHVKVLALDGNKLTSVGRGMGKLKSLEKLHLRGNNLTSMPEGVPGESNISLNMLSLSSNQLTFLPTSLSTVASLKELYLNGNQIEALQDGLAEKLTSLKKLNLAHNSIGKGLNVTAGSQGTVDSNDGDETMLDADDNGFQQLLPDDFVQRFGMPEPLTGNCIKDEGCIVRMEGNPMAEAIKRKHLEEERRKAKEMAMETEVIE